MLKIAIVSGPENGSPRILAETLGKFIQTTDNTANVFFKAKTIKRLLNGNDVKYNKILWFLYKMFYYLHDRYFFYILKQHDAIIICDWTPNGFYKHTYNIERLKKLVKGKAILYYAVQYLGNSPTQIEKLKLEQHSLTERYDWHLSVSEVTEIRQKPAPPWSQIGLYLKSTGLKPEKKQEFLAVVDFVRKGYEHYREDQISVLEEMGIPYVSLEKKYSIEEIRNIYRKASLYFIQFPEAFGMPIAECLACGSYVCTPDSSWPMAWRLDENPEVHGPGILPECFIVYHGLKDLKKQIESIKNRYDLVKSPQKVFEIFYKNYFTFYEGNSVSLNEVLDRFGTGSI